MTHMLEGGAFWYRSQLLGCSHGVWLIDSRSALWDRHGVMEVFMENPQDCE